MRPRKRKYWSTLLIGLLILLALLKYINGNKFGNQCSFEDRRNPSELVYSNHARCRMVCREVPEKLIEEVYLKGKVNCKKSRFEDDETRYALEMKDRRGDRIRLVVAIDEDDDAHVVVTVIRLDKDDLCECS